jgi:Ssp1 endopeptidase immunity protein Rap1a
VVKAGDMRDSQRDGGQEMARKVNAFLITLCLLFASEASAISGNEWQQGNTDEQRFYVWGVIDAWQHLKQVAALSVLPPSGAITIFTKLAKCVSERGMTYGQMFAIVQKYMENNPAEWHYAMVSLVWSALNRGCVPTGK